MLEIVISLILLVFVFAGFAFLAILSTIEKIMGGRNSGFLKGAIAALVAKYFYEKRK